jgi:hypothetical protein
MKLVLCPTLRPGFHFMLRQLPVEMMPLWICYLRAEAVLDMLPTLLMEMG